MRNVTRVKTLMVVLLAGCTQVMAQMQQALKILAERKTC